MESSNLLLFANFEAQEETVGGSDPEALQETFRVSFDDLHPPNQSRFFRVTGSQIIQEVNNEGDYVAITAHKLGSLREVWEAGDGTNVCVKLFFEDEDGVKDEVHARMGHSAYQRLRQQLSSKVKFKVRRENGEQSSKGQLEQENVDDTSGVPKVSENSKQKKTGSRKSRPAENSRKEEGFHNVSNVRGKTHGKSLVTKSKIKDTGRAGKLSCQPMYRRMKEKVAGMANSFAKQEIVALTTHNNLLQDQVVDIEWEVRAVVKMDNKVVQFSALSQTKISDPPQQFRKLKPDDDLEQEIEILSTALGRDTKRNEDEAEKGLTKESGKKQNGPKKSAKSQPPPAIAVTPKDKVRAPFNNNNAKSAQRKVLVGSSSDEGERVRPGLSGSAPPKKKARMVTSTPVMSGNKQRGSAKGKARGGKGRGGRVGGGPGGSRVVTSNKKGRGTRGSLGKCKHFI